MNESPKRATMTNRVNDKVTPKIGAHGVILQVAAKTKSCHWHGARVRRGLRHYADTSVVPGTLVVQQAFRRIDCRSHPQLLV
jgi:hypothetical protein